ncbi:MAG: cell division protein FtsX [Deferribacterales bacterium]
MKISVVLRNGLRLFRETLSLNLASVVTVITVLFIYSMFVIIGSSSDSFLREITKTDSMRVYVKSSSKSSVDDLIRQIQEIEGVRSISYYSQEDAYSYLKDSAVNINYLDKIPAELFPAFIEIAIKDDFQDVSRLREMERRVMTLANVDVASYGEKWIQNFSDIRSAVRIFLVVLTVLLTASVGIIIFNTIRLSLFRYREDIKIYNLVGATRTFIEIPYIICSFVEITIAYFISSAFVYLFMLFMNVRLLAPVGLNFIVLPDVFYFLKTYIYLVVISAIASMISVASFLNKVKSINES